MMIQHFRKSDRERSVGSRTDIFSRNRSPNKNFRLDPFCTVLFGFMWFLLTIRLLMVAPPAAQVGDMLEFRSTYLSITNVDTTVLAYAVKRPLGGPGHVCTLDVQKMMRPGGVLTVTAVRRADVMTLWSGKATAAGGADCGENSEILITDNDYSRLRMSQQPGNRQILKR
jgi:hypothetical protein